MQQSMEELQKNPTEENLWACILAHQGYPFYTASGLPFSYTVKRGRDGGYNKELIVDRRENSKTLTWGSLRMAFARGLEQKGQIVPKPKALGDIRGVSYIYPLLWHFGMIEVPEKTQRKLRGETEEDLQERFF